MRASRYLIALFLGVTSTCFAQAPTWTSIGPEGGFISALAIDPASPTTLYAGTRGGGVFKSTDGGTSWSAINSGLADTDVLALAIDPVTPTTLYAGTNVGGVFKSTNAGASWAAMNLSLACTSVSAIAIDRAASSTVYVGGAGGACRSTDGGGSWSAVNLGLTNTVVLALAIDHTTPTTLYAGTNGGGVFKSTNGGNSWAVSNTGLPNNTGVAALVIDPITPTTIYAGTNSGAFKSTNGGATWSFTGLTPVVNVLGIDPVTSTTLYAGTNGGGAFKSTDGGGSWNAINSGLINAVVFALALDPVTPTTVYVGTLGGAFRSANGGGSWSAINSGFTNSDVAALAFDPVTPTTIYAGTNVGGVFKSSDAGASWTAINSGLTSTVVRVLAFDPATPTNLYAGTNGGGVFVLRQVVQPLTITSISPSSGTQGQTISNFIVTGGNFQPTSTISFSGMGITVNSYISRTANQIVASVNVASTASTGIQNVIVTNPDGQQSTLTNAFTVALLMLSACPVSSSSCTPSISFAYQAGSGSSAQPQQVAVSTNGPAIPFSATTTSSSSRPNPLMFVAPSSGTTPSTLNVSVAPNLSPGTYTGGLTVLAPGAVNSPVILGITLTVSMPATVPGQGFVVFRWPLDPDFDRSDLNQDYAEFDHVGTQKFHVGVDIGAPSGTSVFAVAGGHVKLVPMQPSNVANPDNHCMGNVVIIDHSLSGNGRGPFTLYAHLQEIESRLQNGQQVNQGDVVGAVGTTGFNQLSRRTCQGNRAAGPHLHFEVKDSPVLENPTGGPACTYGAGKGPCWGYTPDHPDLFGFHDPIQYLHQLTPSSPRSVIITQSGVNLRVGPGGSGANTALSQSYRTLNTGLTGVNYRTTGRLAPPTAVPACEAGWEQIVPADSAAFPGLRFPDATQPPGSIPDAWLCRDLLLDVP
jgi:murein DD-endopeptidase MepM/ murein hydrolase activator NlpD/photosystem II stability/assembly factor-like uncharacterized protein